MPDGHVGSEGGEVLVRRGVRHHIADAHVEVTPRLGRYEVAPP